MSVLENYLPPRTLQYSDYIAALYPEMVSKSTCGSGENYEIKTITFQVTEDCCLKCTYCYQSHNKHISMDFETAKKFIDGLVEDKYDHLNSKNTKGVIIEFIGGEPFLKIDLITQITDYFFERMLLLRHPWLMFFRLSISTNGLLYFNKKVQKYLTKYAWFLSLNISIDGHKELHDLCRIDLENKGSYDRVIKAVHSYRDTFGIMPETKMTFSPNNISELSKAYFSMIEEGYLELNGNCVYEEGWELCHSTTLYNELVKVADYLIDNDLYNKIYVSFFDEDEFHPMLESDNENWCGGVGCAMVALDGGGKIYHCIRYMSSSLQGDQKPLPIGDIESGISQTQTHKENLAKTSNITRRSQSTDECFYCPIAQGCSWCSAYNYQCFGTVNKRATYICIMHKANSLANVYFWNKLYSKLGMKKVFKRHLSDEDSLKIISLEELEKLNSLERR